MDLVSIRICNRYFRNTISYFFYIYFSDVPWYQI